ncbi:MAG: hypothetical protein GF387_03065 [Candidatus Portnoybacteria bacterium]|nr:hypothetical protein [Candidatus Portnoybacteria bacterium]
MKIRFSSAKIQKETMKNKILVGLIFFLILIPIQNIIAEITPTFPMAGNLTYQGTEIPRILPRSTWENSENLKELMTWHPGQEEKENKPLDYYQPKRIIVHDMGCDPRTKGCNDKERDPIETIQAIYRYHAVTKNWGDIGYHYIIDYWGNIYEGRYGGNGVRAAHTYDTKTCNNFNVETVGIMLMGNYENHPVPEIMKKTLSRLIAWISFTNSIDPTEMNLYTRVWHNQEKNNTCSTEEGGFTKSFTGPTVLAHSDIEKANTDLKELDLHPIREQSNNILKKYNHTFTTKNQKTYKIENGTLIETTPNQNTISINKNQIQYFPNNNIPKLANGELIKSDTRNRIYLIQDNKRKAILSEQLFKLKGYNKNKIKEITDRNLAQYPITDPVMYPNGTLIKGPTPEVYLIQNNQRKHITSPTLFQNKGYKWEDILTVTEKELMAHPLGEKVCFNDGTLIKGPTPEVYLIKNQKRHWIKTASVFSRLGYNWNQITQVQPEEVAYYSLGSIIDSITDKQEPEEPKTTEEPRIKIGIHPLKQGEVFKITANGPYEIYENDEFVGLNNNQEIYQTTISTKTKLEFIPKTENIIFEIISYTDSPSWKPSLNDNQFRGKIKVEYSNQSNKTWIVNDLKIDDYLKGIAEALDDHPIEYIKSLVTAARSYALFHVSNGGKHQNEIFHLNNTPNDQLYKGYGFEKRAPNISKAVEETKGVVGTYNNKPIRAAYSSDSGGITKSACSLWGGVFCTSQYNYLKGGIRDPESTEHSNESIKASHGVGISATGARTLAEQGKTYQEILKYYYPGIEVKKIY